MAVLKNKDGSITPKRPNDDDNLVDIVTTGVDKFLSGRWNGGLQDRRDDLINCFIDGDWRPFRNVYELAKDGFDFEFDVDMEFLGYLEEMDGCIRGALDKLVEQWANENDIVPPFTVGDKLCFVSGGCLVSGEITEIKSKAHFFLVKEDNREDDGRRVIINFEDAMEYKNTGVAHV